MANLTIDGRPIEIAAGETILSAASRAGISIPTLCWIDGCAASGSCMVCAVKVAGAPRYLPACTARAESGMALESDTDEVAAMRRKALEYLLGDHLGECVAMCRRACPAGLDIPLLMSHGAARRWDEAAALVRAQLPLAGVLGRVCHAPCEKVCRRGALDDPVAIRSIEHFAAERDVAASPSERRFDETIAVVGSGAAGLAAAWRLLQLGYGCILYDAAEALGESLRVQYGEAELPHAILAAELARVVAMGLEVRLGVAVGHDLSWQEITQPMTIVADGDRDDIPEVESIVRVRAAGKLVQQVAAGLDAAMIVHRSLAHDQSAHDVAFRSMLRRLDDGEMLEFIKGCNPASTSVEAPLSASQACAEASRCGQCDCTVAASCQLRVLSARYEARQRHPRSSDARYERRTTLPHMYFLPGKCILCGQCVRVAQEAGEPLDLGIQGRGMRTTVGGSNARASLATALACIAICPTGALTMRPETNGD